MKLLCQDELEKSATVANNTMNRERNLSGVNSYKKDLYLDIVSELTQAYKNHNKVVNWMDLCCGAGKAVIQAGQSFQNKHPNILIDLEGLDLVDFFDPIPNDLKNVKFLVGSLTSWQSKHTYDLITCVHGLHYIGDKFKAIQIACERLKPHGKFCAHLDLNNIKVKGNKNSPELFKQFFRENKISYNARRKILTCIGNQKIKNNFIFKGANDQAGPNYTGQPAVDSYYTIM